MVLQCSQHQHADRVPRRFVASDSSYEAPLSNSTHPCSLVSIAVRSRPNVPHQLVLGTVFEFASQLKVLWSVLWRADEGYADPSAETADLFRQLGAVSSSIINIEKAAEGVQSIVVRPPLDEQEKEKAEVPPFILVSCPFVRDKKACQMRTYRVGPCL